jgi:hypothetical protein
MTTEFLPKPDIVTIPSGSTLSDYAVGLLLEQIRDNCWLGLHFDDPNLAGAYASEISGGGYTREKATFTTISNRTMWLDNSVQFDGLRGTKITHFGGWDSRRTGNVLFWVRLAVPKRISESKGFLIGANQLVISIK